MTTHHASTSEPIGSDVGARDGRSAARTPVEVVLVLWVVFLIGMAVLLWAGWGVIGVVVGGVVMAGPIGLCWDEIAARYGLWPWHSRTPPTT